jgi:hypothetical protein
MSIGISSLFDQSELLLGKGRFVAAIEILEQARGLTKVIDRKAWATFNLGVIHWTKLGNGDRARTEFLAAATGFEEHGSHRSEAFRLMHAAAIENAMLCALSYEEFDQLAVRLRELTPEMPILAGLVPKVCEARERGAPWSDMLLTIAGSYYNRNRPELDRGAYGQAKSTYQLLLVHKRALRLQREDWRMCVVEICALAMRMTADCLRVGGDRGPNPSDEYLPIVTDVLPLVDAYLDANSGDDDVRSTRDKMHAMIEIARGAAPKSDGTPRQTARAYACSQCHAPVLKPLLPCPACQYPSPVIALRPILIAAIAGMLVAGTVVAYFGHHVSTWLRIVMALIGGAAGFGASGWVAFQIGARMSVDSQDRV